MNLKTKTVEIPELKIERIFNAPRDLVWRAWTDKDKAVQWGGPRDWPMISFEGDFKVGGKYRATLQEVNGTKQLHHNGVYREIKTPERLVYTFTWENGHDMPEIETLITVVFEDQGNKTRMIFTQQGFDTVASRDGHNGGWNSAFDRLDDFISGKL